MTTFLLCHKLISFLKVIDDESDYFNSTSVWLTKSEKAQIEKFAKEMHEKKHKSRANKSIILDFAGLYFVNIKIFRITAHF